MADQRCGTCRWASTSASLLDLHPRLIDCGAPAPDSTGPSRRSVMWDYQGTKCVCYQPATQPQTEDCPDAD